MPGENYCDPAVLARIHGLHLRARQIVEGYVAGLHKSPYHGFSVEFAEHREYVPGDDLRYVDWKVFGKTDRYYLKQYEEETNFACWFLLDVSESMDYRSDAAPWPKADYARTLIASLTHFVLQQQDAVGLALFDTSVRQLVRAAGHAAQFKQVCHVLEMPAGAGKTSLGPVFHDLAERIARRGLLVVVSDGFDDPAALLLGLKHLRHRRHDVILFQIVDPAEVDFPFTDPTLFKGLEGWPEQMTDPRSLRAAYQQEFQAFVRQVQTGCRELRIDHLLLRTDQRLDAALSNFLARRQQRGAFGTR